MQVGYSTLEITPSRRPFELAGYGYFLNRMSTDIDSPLLVQVIAFSDEKGRRAALCGIDVLMIHEDTYQRIKERVVSLSHGSLEDVTILLAPSHTHSGPATYPMIGLGGMNWEYLEQEFIPVVATAIVNAFEDSSEAEVGSERMETEGLSFNRTEGEDEVIDHRLSILRINTERGSLGSLHFPCHPVIYGRGSTVISSEFPGRARMIVEREMGIKATWLTGFCGNIDPEVNRFSKGKTNQADVDSMGRRLADGAIQLFSEVKTGAANLWTFSAQIELPIDGAFRLIPDQEVEVYRKAKKLGKKEGLEPIRRWFEMVAPLVNQNLDLKVKIPVDGIGLGSIVLLGVGAEPYSELGLLVEKLLPELTIFCIGTCNGNVGYIPTVDEFERNSYGVRNGSFIFERKPLLQESGQIFTENITKLLTSGRK